jgi:hypothetical protein
LPIAFEEAVLQRRIYHGICRVNKWKKMLAKQLIIYRRRKKKKSVVKKKRKRG